MKILKRLKAIEIIFLVFFLFMQENINAQVGIGIANPAASAQLDVSSSSKGFLPPRMTQAQRNAIVNPAPGLMIWCTDCGLKGEIMVHNGTSWTRTTGREGKNYYVSSLGDDNNDGLSPSTPWKTLVAVNNKMTAFSPGDSILFERGSYFFGSYTIGCFGTNANPIIFSAYGTGPKPVFIAAVQIWPNYPGVDLSAVWTPLGNNIWEYTDIVLTGADVDVANLVYSKNHQTSFGIKLKPSDSYRLSSQGQFCYNYDRHKIIMYSESDPKNYYDTIQYVRSVSAIDFNFKDHPYLIFENLDFRYYVENPRKLTPFGQNKLTPSGHFKLTP